MNPISRRRTLVLLAGTSLAGCSTISALLNPPTAPTFAAFAALITSGTVVVQAVTLAIKTGVLAKGSALQVKIDQGIKAFAAQEGIIASDAAQNVSLAQTLFDNAKQLLNTIQSDSTSIAATPSQVAAMHEAHMAMRRAGFVFSLVALISFVVSNLGTIESGVSAIAGLVKTLISEITNSSSSTVSDVTASDVQFQSTMSAYNQAVAA